MELIGRAHKFELNNLNTDYIIPGKRKFRTSNLKELSKYIMEDLAPDFYKKIKKGDFLVGKNNFGCGSSREQAVWVIKEAGLSAVIAKSFARIFYRNAFNIGLLLIECNTDKIKNGDKLEIRLEKGIIKNLTRKTEIFIRPIPPLMLKLLSNGGVVAHFNKYGGFKI